MAVAVGLVVGLAMLVSGEPSTTTSGALETVLGDFDLTPGSQGAAPCARQPGDDDLSFIAGSAATHGQWTIDGGYKTRFRLGTPPSGAWFQADLDFTGSSGGYPRTHPGPPAIHSLIGQLVVNALIHQIAGPHCVKGNLQCNILGVVTITSGTSTGPLPTPSNSGSTLLLDADTATTGFPLVTSSCGGASAGARTRSSSVCIRS